MESSNTDLSTSTGSNILERSGLLWRPSTKKLERPRLLRRAQRLPRPVDTDEEDCDVPVESDNDESHSSAKEESKRYPNWNKNQDPGIVEWSMDHHVFRVPVYQGRDDECAIYQVHKDMLATYQQFNHPSLEDATKSDVTIYLGSIKTETGPSWMGVHQRFSQSLSESDSRIMSYQTYSVGNIVRSLEADHQYLEEPEQGQATSNVPGKHSRRNLIAESYGHFDHLLRILDDRVARKDELALSQYDEMFEAMTEAFVAYQTFYVHGFPMGQFVQGLKARLNHYPIQFSVDGAFTVSVTIPTSHGHISDLNILRNLAFFEPLHSDTSTSTGVLQFHLPLLLIKDQPQSGDPKLDGKVRIATRNEERIATASAAWFLAQLDIKDFPVFGLVTCGEKGYLSQAWFSSAENCCYVTDCDIYRDPFDLGAGGLPRYEAFLWKLRDHARKLWEQFQENGKKLLESALKGNDELISSWSARVQHEEQ